MNTNINSIKKLCSCLAELFVNSAIEVVDFLSFCIMILNSIKNCILHPSKIRWKNTFYYMDSVGSNATAIISLLGFLIGVILAFQAIVQLSRFGVEGYVVNLVGSVIVTELAPLVTAVVIAGRTGSSYAAELGLMKSAEEVDALITMGFDIGNFLIIPKIIALLLVMPGLTVIADVCGVLGGMAIVTSMLHLSPQEYFAKTFEIIQPIDFLQGICKSVLFALLIGLISCLKGLKAERDAQSVGNSATSAVVTSIFFIVVADAVMTSVFGALSI